MNAPRKDFRPLHVVASNDRRGAETAAVALSDALARCGAGGAVVALAPGDEGGLEIPVLGPTRFSATTLHRLRELAGDASVVVAHGSSTLPAVAAATVAVDTPFVYRSIGDPSAWVTTRARRLRVRAAARRAAALVALWRGAAVTWHSQMRIRPERIHVIPNASDPVRFSPPTPEGRRDARAALELPLDGPVAICLGALTREKRVDLAIETVAALEGATLVVVGSGPEGDALAALSEKVGGGRVRFIPQTDRPEQALAAADALLLPSDTEGQPAVAIEAGLTGLPVIATRVGGLPEIVVDGRTGVLVQAGDVSAMAAGLTKCLAQRARFGAEARSHCLDNFDITHVVGQWCTLLQSLVNT